MRISCATGLTLSPTRAVQDAYTIWSVCSQIERELDKRYCQLIYTTERIFQKPHMHPSLVGPLPHRPVLTGYHQYPYGTVLIVTKVMNTVKPIAE